jgi:hypothetical protein
LEYSINSGMECMGMWGQKGTTTKRIGAEIRLVAALGVR